MKPKIFIASSSEKSKIASFLAKKLKNTADVTVWFKDVAELSEFFIDSLLRKIDETDYGIVIMAPDDILIQRTVEYQTPRDNVLLELGIFIGKLGRQYSFLVCPDFIENLHIPSDLFGITVSKYNSNKSYNIAFKSVLKEIKAEINNHKKLDQKNQPIYNKIFRLLNLYIIEYSNLSGVEIKDIGIHYWKIQYKTDNQYLMRKVRSRLSSVTPSKERLYKYGEAIVGQCWKTQSDIGVNLFDSKYDNLNQDEWDKLSDYEKVSQDYQEFLNAKKYFKAIFVTPIVNQNKEIIGCLSLNIEKESNINYQSLWTNEIKETFRKTAEIISILEN